MQACVNVQLPASSHLACVKASEAHCEGGSAPVSCMQELRRDLEVVIEACTLEQHEAAQKEEELSRSKRALGLSAEAARKTSALSASITQLELLCLSLPASLDVKTSPTPLMTAPWKQDDSAELEQVLTPGRFSCSGCS